MLWRNFIKNRPTEIDLSSPIVSNKKIEEFFYVLLKIFDASSTLASLSEEFKNWISELLVVKHGHFKKLYEDVGLITLGIADNSTLFALFDLSVAVRKISSKDNSKYLSQYLCYSINLTKIHEILLKIEDYELKSKDSLISALEKKVGFKEISIVYLWTRYA